MKIKEIIMANKVKKMILLSMAISTILLLLMIYTRYAEVSVAVPKWAEQFYTSIEENKTNFFLTQLSLTFITISVMSILSDNSVTIYWENIVQRSLIDPVYSCFYSFTVYCFEFMVMSGIALMLNSNCFFALFFVGNCVSLGCLTFKMINVYYNRDGKKAYLEKEFIDLFKNNGTKNKKDEIALALRQNTLKAYANKDYDVVIENLDFCVRNFELFQNSDDLVYFFRMNDDVLVAPLVQAYSEIVYRENDLMKKEQNRYLAQFVYHSALSRIPTIDSFLYSIVDNGNSNCIWSFQRMTAAAMLNEYNEHVPDSCKIGEIEILSLPAKRRTTFFKKDLDRMTSIENPEGSIRERLDNGFKEWDSSVLLNALIIQLQKIARYAIEKESEEAIEGLIVFFSNWPILDYVNITDREEWKTFAQSISDKGMRREFEKVFCKNVS